MNTYLFSIRIFIFLLLWLTVPENLISQNIQNPVLPGVADAGVLKYNGRYYIGGVFTDGAFYTSEDLVNWNGPVQVFNMDNAWSAGTGAGNDQIHANDMFYLNGKFHLYWSVNYWGKDKHIVHIAHAESDSILGPYTEPVKDTWFDNRIDPHIFQDDNGELYMYMVRFTDGNTIWARPMKDLRTFSGHPVCLFASLPDTWETMDNRVAEGPWVIKYRDRYYMMYNANHTGTDWGNYQLGVAEADSPLAFNNGNKYSHPVVGANRTELDERYVDLLRYNKTYSPLFSFTEDKPGSDWEKARYNDAAWQKGQGGFASSEVEGSTVRTQGTVWSSPALWLRKPFVASAGTGNLALRVTHDGDTRIYLNGTLIYEKQGRDYCIVNLNQKQRALLKEGNNLLAIETHRGARSNYFDVSLFDMKDGLADDILMTPGQPNILRGPNGFEWWLIYMANKNNERRSQYIDRVHFFDKTMFVDGITGPRTPGYHPEPSLPTFAIKKETSSFGVLNEVQPATSYLFETSVRTNGEAGIVVWWKDAANCAYVGLDKGNQCWYLRVLTNGKEDKKTYNLPSGFRWGVYHNIRIERNGSDFKLWIDKIPASGQAVFTTVIPAVEGVPGVFDMAGDALFEGTCYTIGFDDEAVTLAANSEVLKGEPLNDYELSFQLYGLSNERSAGCYPVYVDGDNYVKAQFNGVTGALEVTSIRKGKQAWRKEYPLDCLQTIYPDVKYTDFIEKTYRFSSPTWLDELYLSRHNIDNKSQFEDNMFGKFTVEYLSQGRWYPIDTQAAEVARHPAYNRLSFAPLKAESIRFINKQADDLQRHIYKIGINERLKESYNFRAVRRGNKLYLFVDGRELGALDINYPASRIGFCSGNYEPAYKGIMYYHINN